jgi:molybdenum cofactor cytidylyltransferase
MIFGLIPAAGKSARMGRPKLLLPLGRRTVIEHTIDALRAAAIEQILVVVGPDNAELAAVAKRTGAHTLSLESQTPEMRSTVEEGLAWLETHFHPSADDYWLLVPADHPTLDKEVVEELVKVSCRSNASTIFVPTFEGKRGHPALLSWKHVAGIRAFSTELGINAYLRDHSEILEVAVKSSEILLDLDTPADYERLKERHGYRNQGAQHGFIQRS